MIELEIAGAGLVAHRAGALWWPEERALVVADLHLEKATAFARRGIFLPPYDSRATLAALATLVHIHAPRVVIALGDSFHDPYAAARLDPEARELLESLMLPRSWVWIAGNHDPAPPPGLGGEAVHRLPLGSLTFRHEPAAPPVPGEIAGHLHPAARVDTRGRTLRRRCFATDGERIILPAFGAFAGGLNVLDAAVRPLFARSRFQVLVLGRERLHAIQESILVADSSSPLNGTFMQESFQ